MQPPAPIHAYHEGEAARPVQAAPRVDFPQDELQALIDLGCRFLGLIEDASQPAYKEPYDRFLSAAAVRAFPWIGWEPASLGLAVIDVDGDGAKDPPASREARAIARELVKRRFGPPIATLLSGSGPVTGRAHLLYRVTGKAPIGFKPDGVSPYMQFNEALYAHHSGSGSGTRFDLKWKHGYCKIPRAEYLTGLLAAARSDAPPVNLGTVIPWGSRHSIKAYRPAPTVNRASLHGPAVDPPRERDTAYWREWSEKRIADLDTAVFSKGQRHGPFNREAFTAGAVSHKAPFHIDAVRAAAARHKLHGPRLRASVEDGYRAGLRAPRRD